MKVARTVLFILGSSVAALVLGCGSSGSNSQRGPGDAASDSSSSRCPKEPPGIGPCSPNGLECSYCGLSASCVDGSWEVAELACEEPEGGVDARADAKQDAPGSCPATEPTGSSSEGELSMCASPTNCSYGATCCSCVATPSCGDEIVWWCGGTEAPAPCPSALPSNGDSCPAHTLGSCKYCTPEGYLQATCGDDGKFSIGPVVGGCAG
jgi:hypothetical protein